MGTNMASPYKALDIWLKHFSNNAHMNHRTDLNLGEVVYISFIFHILAS